MAPFGTRLTTAVGARESQILLGLDPDPQALWQGSWDAVADGPPAARAADAVAAHCRRAIDETAPAIAGVKLQLACFERLGAPGWSALAAVAAHAREQSLLVLADGKRGDIDVSAAAYADALLGQTDTPAGPVAGLGADAITVAPYMGPDTIVPFVDRARAAGGGVFVLLRTSNPGAEVFEDAPMASGAPLWEAVAGVVAELGDDAPLADVGAVVGATAPEHLARVRALLPRAPLLIPGVGAQGGDPALLSPAFTPGRAGGLVTASRSIVGAGPDGARAAAETLREAVWALGTG